MEYSDIQKGLDYVTDSRLHKLKVICEGYSCKDCPLAYGDITCLREVYRLHADQTTKAVERLKDLTLVVDARTQEAFNKKFDEEDEEDD